MPMSTFKCLRYVILTIKHHHAGLNDNILYKKVHYPYIIWKTIKKNKSLTIFQNGFKGVLVCQTLMQQFKALTEYIRDAVCLLMFLP